MKKYDVIVIGGGGGTKISTPAYNYGYKSAIVEEAKMGGTCLNRGCIPSKMLIHPANVGTIIKEAKKFDINIKNPSFSTDMAKLITRITETVGKDSDRIHKGLESGKGPDFYHGHAVFKSDNVIEVNGEELTADRIFITTGARPSIPPIEGLEGTPYWTSTEALNNTKPIKKLLVIGGGYIACELGYAYSALGVETEFIVRSGLINREDPEVVKEFTKVFTSTQNVHLNTNTKSVKYENDNFTVTVEKDGKQMELTGDALLVAVGVKPNTDNLGLENTKVKLDKRGFVQVNEYMEAAPGIYAMGDVIGRYLFRHAVNFEGEFLFRTLFLEEEKQKIVYPPMPHAIFTHPEVAGVGKTEEELNKEGIPFVSGTHPYRKSAMGMARLCDHGFVKLLFDKKTRKLLGAHIIGEEASNMIHQFIYAMTNDATVDSIVNMIYIHPAINEIARNAARNALIVFDMQEE